MDIDKRIAKLNDKARRRREERQAEEQMDFWPDDKRAAPNSMVRCALFRGAMAGRQGARVMHRETLIASLGNEEIYYSGEDLDQKDMDVWMAVLQVFRELGVGEVAYVTGNQLLKLAGLPNSGQSHKALDNRLKRLTFSRVDVISTKAGSREVFHGALLQRAHRAPDGQEWEISLAPQLKALFTEGYTWVDWEIRHHLKRAPLAQWLHAFYRSHRDPLPFTVDTLRTLCGSQTKELRFFRNDLKKSLRRLQEACHHFGVLLEWSHDPRGDKVVVEWISRETQKRLK